MRKNQLVKIVVAVRGSYPFPVDMLRYDEVFPATESDSAHMARACSPESVGTTFIIHLTRWAEPGWQATAGRWQSQLWEVIAELPQTPVRSGSQSMRRGDG